MQMDMECKAEGEGDDFEEYDFEGVNDTMTLMTKIRESVFENAKKNIDGAQVRYKRNYDSKRKQTNVKV